MKIYLQIVKVMNELGAIAKGRMNSHQNYSFRGIEDFYNSIHPVISKNGIFIATQVVDKISETHQRGEKVSFRVMLNVNHKFYAEDGSFVEVITSGEGIDTSDKATSKAMSMAMKYAFIQTFSIPTQDMSDPERDSPSVEVTNPKNSAVTKPAAKSTQSVESAYPRGSTDWEGFPDKPLDAREPVLSAPNQSAVDSYRVPFGKTYKGMSFEEMGLDKVVSFSMYLQESAAKENKPMGKQAQEFCDLADDFIRIKKRG